jgi:hypothetical protein
VLFCSVASADAAAVVVAQNFRLVAGDVVATAAAAAAAGCGGGLRRFSSRPGRARNSFKMELAPALLLFSAKLAIALWYVLIRIVVVLVVVVRLQRRLLP